MIMKKDTDLYEEILGSPLASKLAKILNAQGYKNKQGKEWTNQSIRHYLPDTPRRKGRLQPESLELEQQIIDALIIYKKEKASYDLKKQSLMNSKN